MFFLNKVFQLRNQANPEMEKPFLEHLEDLRIMITRMLVTLIVATLACFVFQGQVMDVLREPAEEVFTTRMQATLPSAVRVEDWERAKEVLDDSLVLEGSEREAFFAHFEPETRRLIEASRYLRAADALPEDARDAYLEQVASGDPELAALIATLRDTGAEPHAGGGSNLTMMSSLKPTETFMLSMKLAFFSGIVVSFPFLLYFLMQFVVPGLHHNERKVLWPSMAVGFGLFLFGVLFAYFLVLPRALVFFYEWDQGLGVGSDWRIGWYIGFATQFTLVFGLAFELPVVVMALVKIGLLDYEMMSRTRRYAFLAIVVVAAVITPTGDMLTLSMMSLPMYFLYEVCIWLAWAERRKQARGEAEEEGDRDRFERLLTAEDERDLLDIEDEEEDRGDEGPGDPPGGRTPRD